MGSSPRANESKPRANSRESGSTDHALEIRRASRRHTTSLTTSSYARYKKTVVRERLSLKEAMQTVKTLFILIVLSVLSPSTHAQELKKVRIGYPAFSLTFLTFFVAKDAGIYKKHGLDVDMVQMAGAVQTSALVAGEIDYLTGITSPLVAAARGLTFKGIMVTRRPRSRQAQRRQPRTRDFRSNRLGLKQRTSAQPGIGGRGGTFAAAQRRDDTERLPRTRIGHGI